MPSKPIFDARLWAMEGPMRKYEASLFHANGERYFALVEAIHFPAAYAKAKRMAQGLDCTVGKISQV